MRKEKIIHRGDAESAEEKKKRKEGEEVAGMAFVT